MANKYNANIIPVKLGLNNTGELEMILDNDHLPKEIKKYPINPVGKPNIMVSYVNRDYFDCDYEIKHRIGSLIRQGNCENKLIDYLNNEKDLYIGYHIGDIMVYKSGIDRLNMDEEKRNPITSDGTVMVSCQLYHIDY